MKGTLKRATIYDVARVAGVSITTVSRFLNNSESVKKTTVSRIANTIRKLDYIPQGNAGSKADRSVGRIGVLTPFFPAPSFVQRLNGMMPIFKQHNFEMVVYTIEGPEQLDEYLTSVPFTRRIDGLILMSIVLTPEHRRILKSSGMHVVIVESDDEHYSRVIADNYQGGTIAAQLFLKKNYNPVAYIGDRNHGSSYSLNPSDIRLKGFMDTLDRSGRKINSPMIVTTDILVEDTRILFGKLLDGENRPGAVFAMSDLQAIGALKAARERNIKIPEELAVLGFDNIESADWLGLSTITQHLGDSGRIAADLLLKQISGKCRAIQRINLQVELIERDTT